MPAGRPRQPITAGYDAATPNRPLELRRLAALAPALRRQRAVEVSGKWAILRAGEGAIVAGQRAFVVSRSPPAPPPASPPSSRSLALSADRRIWGSPSERCRRTTSLSVPFLLFAQRRACPLFLQARQNGQRIVAREGSSVRTPPRAGLQSSGQVLLCVLCRPTAAVVPVDLSVALSLSSPHTACRSRAPISLTPAPKTPWAWQTYRV